MKDNGQCKWLKNVPVLILGLQRDNSYIGAIESALGRRTFARNIYL